jgi:Domain of unknown function (DUF222)/HNH endonuclease
MFERSLPMSELRSALDELGAVDPRAMSDEDLGVFLDEIERGLRIMEAHRGRGLAEFERRKAYANDGHLSAAAWLSHRQGLSHRGAEWAVRRARSLDQMPEVARAFAEGEVSGAAVDELARTKEAAPEAFARSEGALVEVARTVGHGELRRVTATWRAAAHPERALADEDERHERRRLDICPDANGMTRVSGEFDGEGGQSLITAIRAVMDAWARSGTDADARTPAQRRADALGEICRQWLASRDRPTVGGERPHVVVTIDHRALLEQSAGHAELADTGSITPEAARRLVCDAQITRVITGPGSEPLELGRTTKVVPPGLRRAVSIRDRGCRFLGCGRPSGWCDCHHVRHWADGGETSLSNLVLLCRPHHRAIHRGFGVEMVEGRPAFTRPDGTPIEDRAPPT